MVSPKLRPECIGAAVGLVGTAALAVGSCNPDFSHHPDGWQWAPADFVAAHLTDTVAGLLLFVGMILIVTGWWILRPRLGGSAVRPIPILVLWSLPLLLVPPVLTGDPFAYADAGWIFRNGENPYGVGLGGLGGPFAAAVDPLWLGGSVAWPPLSIVVSALGIEFMGFHPYWGVIGQRVFALIGVALIAGLLPAVGRKVGSQAAWLAWFGILNPIVVVHFVGGAHMDALAVGVVVLAFWVTVRQPRGAVFALLTSAALVGLAMGLKQYTGLAIVAVAGLPIRTSLDTVSRPVGIWMLGWRSALATAIAVAVFVGTSFATGLGMGWSEELGRWYDNEGSDYPAGRNLTFTPSSLLGDALAHIGAFAGIEGRSVHQAVAAGVSLLGLAVVLLLLLTRPHRPLEVLAWGSLAVAASFQTLHPWYLGLSVVSLALIQPSEPAARALAMATAGFGIGYLWSGARWSAMVVATLAIVWLWLAHRVFGRNEPLIGVVRERGARRARELPIEWEK